MRKSNGFTLIELLIVVAIIGIIAAIALPNLNRAMNQGKQKSTMADMKQIATVVETYQIETDTYPQVADINKLAAVLEPDYIPRLKKKDAWGHEFYYSANARTYTIASCGKGGPDICASPETKEYESVYDPIILTLGFFIQAPDL